VRSENRQYVTAVYSGRDLAPDRGKLPPPRNKDKDKPPINKNLLLKSSLKNNKT
jgi:hypothetical protein